MGQERARPAPSRPPESSQASAIRPPACWPRKGVRVPKLPTCPYPPGTCVSSAWGQRSRPLQPTSTVGRLAHLPPTLPSRQRRPMLPKSGLSALPTPDPANPNPCTERAETQLTVDSKQPQRTHCKGNRSMAGESQAAGARAARARPLVTLLPEAGAPPRNGAGSPGANRGPPVEEGGIPGRLGLGLFPRTFPLGV